MAMSWSLGRSLSFAFFHFCFFSCARERERRGCRCMYCLESGLYLYLVALFMVIWQGLR